jgi:hypothetical protein
VALRGNSQPEEVEKVIVEERKEGALLDPEVAERLDRHIAEARPAEALV